MEVDADRRRSKRARTFLDGRIILNNRNSVIDCTVRDLSETGAKITFAHTVQIPSEFELSIPRRGLVVRARVMWTKGKDLGITFID